MPRPLRRLLPEELYFVTNRTIEQRFLFKPSPVIDAIAGACLAKAVQRFGIELYDYCFMANHFHLLLRAPRGNLPAFMATFQSNLARDINRHLGRRGPVFERRYVATAVLDEGALLERIVYTLNNPVKAGLVSHAKHYQGLSSYAQRFLGAERSFTYLDRVRWWRAGCPQGTQPFERTVTLQLAPLPAEWMEHLSTLLQEDTDRWRHERQLSGKKIPKASQLNRLRPNDRPARSKRSSQPRCHSSQPQLRKAFDAMWHAFVQSYRQAAELVQQGKWKQALFPLGSFPPTRQPVRWEAGPPAVASLCL